ncbi:neprilysin-4 [Cylas formicarius]|uniref:neprilysin-4 n=1 Tax=Cylas formicarius TaxID=197179 RepID=UPI00295858D0|nr:neprilysin-4 [Cylas formicarius]
MEEKASKKFCSCRLTQQENGRIRWSVGQEKEWQSKLKKLVFLPVVLLPLVIIIILVTRQTLQNGNFSDVDTNQSTAHDLVASGTKTQKSNLQINRLTKRHIPGRERFSYLPKRCYKLYMRLLYTPEGEESFAETRVVTENNIKYKSDYGNEYPTYFDRILKFGVNEETRIKRNEILSKKCGKNIVSRNKRGIAAKQRKEFHENLHRFWTEKKGYGEIREYQSKIMQKYMNSDVDPCDNFYEYACGNWKKFYDVPADKTVYDTFEMVRDSLDHILKKLLEDSEENQTKYDHHHNHPIKYFLHENYSANALDDVTIKVKNFYKSCMHEEKINVRGDRPLRDILTALGGWPVITPNWKKSDFDLMGLLSRLRLLNNDILITQWIAPDIKNSDKYIIHIDQTTLGLPSREYYLDRTNIKYLKAYRSFIFSVAKLMGAHPKVASQDVDDIIAFETKLAAIMAPAEERRNITEIYLRTDIEYFAKHFPKFAWKLYFGVVLGKDIDLKTPVACYCARYIEQLFILLNKTNPRIIQNYVMWRFVRHRINNLDHRFLELKQKFYFILFGRESQPPRWVFCVAQTNSNMGMALGALFVKHYFDETSRTDTTEMTKTLIGTFRDMILRKSWLDRYTKNFAKLKINTMNLKIGYPDFITNDSQLACKYGDIEIHPDYFFENMLSILRHANNRDRLRVNSVVDKAAWNAAPAVVNAYYSRTENEIMFPAGILQPPFYHKFFPKALNFGGIGVVIGHEIAHGFDDKGRLFDHEGNLYLWWKKPTIEKFNEKSQCMIDQYSKYSLPDLGLPIDGLLTQGENIADNGGLRQSFEAYNTWLMQNSDADETLPGLNLTGKQLLFLNFAQVWCGKLRKEAARNRIKTSVHSPGLFRVIGALSNSEEFSQTYNCPKNSTMNPELKCIVW